MKTAIPFAVEERKTEPRIESGDHDHDAAGELEPGHERRRGRPVPGQVDDRQRDPVHGEHVDDADHRRAEEPREQQRRPADRAHDERLQQAALGIARDDAEREEDREHDAEEERREHREPEQKGAGEGARVDVDVRRAARSSTGA